MLQILPACVDGLTRERERGREGLIYKLRQINLQVPGTGSKPDDKYMSLPTNIGGRKREILHRSILLRNRWTQGVN